MLGKAPINVGANSGGNTNQAGTFYIEGLNTTPDGLYGGERSELELRDPLLRSRGICGLHSVSEQ